LMFGIGVMLLVGVVVAVVLVVNRGDDTTTAGLHQGPDYSTERPEDIIRKTTGQDPNPLGSGATTNPNPQNPFLRPTHPRITQNPNPPIDTKSSLPDPAEEIEDLANKNSGLTSRCFLRASKGVNAITVGDVKKVVVLMSVDAGGAVTGVTLDGGHQSDALGQCLVPVIKGWKFKPNKGGSVKLTMAAPRSG
jgi:hypothetical protein